MNASLLILLIVSALLSDNFALLSQRFTLILIVAALILNLIVFYSKFEKTWYEARAVAESIKTLSWKYMMRSKPFSYSNESHKTDNKFLKYLKELIGEKKDFFELVGGKFSDNDQISSKMREIRGMNFTERVNVYKRERLNVQLNWYRKKSNYNRLLKNRFFFINIILLTTVLVCIILNFEWMNNVKIITFLITLITSVLAWMQIKNYQELSYSYALTAHELNIIKSKIDQVNSDNSLDNFVDDSESAISREHTMWLARRDHLHLHDS